LTAAAALSVLLDQVLPGRSTLGENEFFQTRELITAAWRADDVDRKRHLFNLAKSYQRVADALDPQPPAEPQVFRNIK
jgi:hypothetical protein